MNNEQATIAHIRAQLAARGWTTVNEHLIENAHRPADNCHLELFHADGRRLGWGLFPRLYCWTEAYTAITGRPWTDAIVRREA